jgi:signal transduction histidine kinase
VLGADGWVLGADYSFLPPILGSLWPLAAVMAAGMVLGPYWGAAAGAAVVSGRLLGAIAPYVQQDTFDVRGLFPSDRPQLLPILSLLALYAAAGLGAGYLARLQRRAGDEIAWARARDEVARALHDGVMQTLAIIQRRAEDPTLVRLAQDTDQDLRNFLAAGNAHGPVGPAGNGHIPALGEGLRGVCDDFARRYGLHPQLLVDDLPKLRPEVVPALVGAAGEALANVGKHARASRVVVYAGPNETAGGVMVTVYDDGCGFDLQAIPTDRGLVQSIRYRIEEVGGRVGVRTAPGQGTEVQLWAQ